MVGIGVFVSHAASIRFETSFQGSYETVIESSDPLYGKADGSQTASRTDFAVEAAWHQGGARRTTIAYLGGVAFRRERSETTLRQQAVLAPQLTLGSNTIPFPGAYQQLFTATSYTTGMTMGIDVTVGVARHVSIVPQVRMLLFDQDWSLRPGITLRWPR
jgi:hypothetical protein